MNYIENNDDLHDEYWIYIKIYWEFEFTRIDGFLQIGTWGRTSHVHPSKRKKLFLIEVKKGTPSSLNFEKNTDIPVIITINAVFKKCEWMYLEASRNDEFNYC